MSTATMKKNNRETIVIADSDYNGTKLVDIRVHYTDEKGDLKPTRKGISIRPEQLDGFVSVLSAFALEKADISVSEPAK